MIIGHFAVGFAAKRWAPRTPLTTLVVAAIFLDTLWPLFVLLGLRDLYRAAGHVGRTRLDLRPYLHSLVMAPVWAFALALAYWVWTRYRRGAVVVGLVALSHWPLDFITHDPDLPLAPGLPTELGVRLGGTEAASVALEVAVFLAGLAVYLFTTRAKSRSGHVSLWSVVTALVFGYAWNLAGPRFHGQQALPTVTLAMLALIAGFVWIDRSRTPRTPPGAAAGA